MQGQREPTSRRFARHSVLRGGYVALAAIAVCIGVRGARAQDAVPSVLIDVGDCVNLKSPGERLDCYERHVEAAKRSSEASPAPAPQASATSAHTDAVAAAPPPAPPVNAPAPAAASAAAATLAATAVATATAPSPGPAPSVTSVSAQPSTPPATLPTASEQSSPADNTGLQNRSQRSTQTAPPDIVATVTEVHETVPNAWLITLDNGQVWRQDIPQRFSLKPGQRVTLRGTKWGTSYRLSAEAQNGFIQVERVR
jgi:hypothetical protein